MSVKSERKKKIYEEKKHNAAIVASQPVEPLPNLNTQQLTKEAMAASAEEFECLSIVCKHIEESRQDLNTDFHGYLEKVEVRDGGEIIGYGFVKSCAACANRAKDNPLIVARVQYAMLSDHTLKAMYKNQGTVHEMVPTSAYGEKLAAEAATEGPNSIN